MAFSQITGAHMADPDDPSGIMEAVCKELNSGAAPDDVMAHLLAAMMALSDLREAMSENRTIN